MLWLVGCTQGDEPSDTLGYVRRAERGEVWKRADSAKSKASRCTAEVETVSIRYDAQRREMPMQGEASNGLRAGPRLAGRAAL